MTASLSNRAEPRRASPRHHRQVPLFSAASDAVQRANGGAEAREAAEAMNDDVVFGGNTGRYNLIAFSHSDDGRGGGTDPERVRPTVAVAALDVLAEVRRAETAKDDQSSLGCAAVAQQHSAVRNWGVVCP